VAREIDVTFSDLDWTAVFGCYRGRGRPGERSSRSEYEPAVEALRARMAHPTAAGTVSAAEADGATGERGLKGTPPAAPVQRSQVRCQVGCVVLAHNLVTLLADREKAKPAARAALPAPSVQ